MSEGPVPSNPDASPAALELLQKLHDQASSGVLFGHQDTSLYGVGWSGEESRSDIKDVSGHWPAVFGWDLGGIEKEDERNIDGVSFETIALGILKADALGGINTISFHQRNPSTFGSVFDNSRAVDSILQGTEKHEKFLEALDRICGFLTNLTRPDGTPIPLVLRPYHERNQEWPWWGKDCCSEEEYAELWQMTVNHCREKHGLHNVLWCFAPQDVQDEVGYLAGYPGDDYVDVLGLDFYAIMKEEHIAFMGNALSMVNRLAESRGKVAALTETGVENLYVEDWWTNYLLAALETDEYSKRTVWALVWRNADEEHYYAPFDGHASVDNFLEMVASDTIVMGPSAEEEEVLLGS